MRSIRLRTHRSVGCAIRSALRGCVCTNEARNKGGLKDDHKRDEMVAFHCDLMLVRFRFSRRRFYGRPSEKGQPNGLRGTI